MSVSGDPDKPFAAGNMITATCVSGGGKPQPQFRWSVAGHDVTNHTETDGDNLEVSSEISFEISITTIQTFLESFSSRGPRYI